MTRQINSRRVFQLPGYFGFASNGVITRTHLVDHHIPAHSQCGRHFWNTQILIILWKERTYGQTWCHMPKNCLRILLMEETEGMEAGSHTLWERSCSRISQANIPVLQVLSPKFYPSFFSQANIPATSFISQVLSKFYLPGKHPCYKFYFGQLNVFFTWAVRLQSDDPLHNWRSRHLLHKNWFKLEMGFQGWDFRFRISRMTFQK